VRIAAPRAEFYAASVPVSRKRKKAKQKQTLQRKRDQGVGSLPSGGIREATDYLAEVTRPRRELDLRRAARARPAAGPLVADLIERGDTLSDWELEDELCTRLGQALTELEDALQADDGLQADGDIPADVSPNTLLEVTIETALDALEEALQNDEGWQAAWRVSAAVARVVPLPVAVMMAEALDELRARFDGATLPRVPTGPALTGQVLWTHDAYGTRTGVVAPFRTGEGPERWYLWDIDACTGETHTVHSRYHVTLDDAVADWQTGVGEPAATGTTFGPIDDRELLDRLMPQDEGDMRIGGESTEQFAEYHRSKRLAEVVLDELPVRSTSVRSNEQSPKDAAQRFSEWFREQRDAAPEPPDFDEIISELADSWQFLGTDGPYLACSPHRITQVMAHVRDFYQEDFATAMTELIPAWVSWLAEESELPAHLAERSRAAALSRDPVNDEPDPLARVTE
jgi:hypothetical protein